MRSALLFITAFVASAAAMADHAGAAADDDECKCYHAYNECRATPAANMSTCASNYADCLGYNPFDGSHNPDDVSDKCSASAAPKTDCRRVKECEDASDECRGQPDANQAQCASDYADCLGFSPFEPEGQRRVQECDDKDKDGDDAKAKEEKHHQPHRNETRPAQPTQAPVQPTQMPVVSGGSGFKALDVFGLLAAGVAALL
ncbi:hypothetical protein BBK36DRAFT_1160625 [Trichoderma citrinoviride]|uniref:Uncharacterized protein n=1 Tax=Trichoderma citrinoviride TaxID=58853 RepID=A0A2T4B7X9_9HYPO|nr:hypothetical protein BBK36DRAFT_1160625 [Trichoderma citrinoviride]PTB65427.1 hypothetical protein BBK36DRAFT_1160625 [Trichoderma citrinoviride]